ncbi:MAG: MBL fold metallo-hydrolase [Candidatus Bipolaricaulia bacterium]
MHSLDGLRKNFGIDRIDVVLVSHFHDDHVCGVPVLQRLFSTECWVAENFADLLEHPEAHCFPCTWPVDAGLAARHRAQRTPATDVHRRPLLPSHRRLESRIPPTSRTGNRARSRPAPLQPR